MSVSAEPRRVATLSDLLVARAPVGIAFLDRDLRFVTVNPALAEMNGLPPEAHVGRTPAEVLPDLDPAAVDGLRRVVETGEPIVGFEISGETKASPGVRRHWLESYYPVRGNDGELLGLIASVTDITDLRRTEDALRASLRRTQRIQALTEALSAALDTRAIAAAIVDHAAEIVGAARGGLGILAADGRTIDFHPIAGYPSTLPDSLVHVDVASELPVAVAVRTATPVYVAHAAEFAAMAPEAVEHGLAPGTSAAVPVFVRGRPAGALALVMPGDHEFDADERALLATIAGLSGQALERVRLTEEAERARHMLAAVIEQMPVGVTISDASGALLAANPLIRKIWGDAPLSRSVDEYAVYRGFHHDGRAYLPDEWPLSRSLATGEVITDEEIAIERFDGSRAITLHSSAPIRDEAGRVIAGVVVLIDVTERREAEAIRDAFIGVLSHELRTPVTSILAGANVVLKQEDRLEPAMRHELLGDIAAEADRLQRLIEDLLVLSRVERQAVLGGAEPVLLQHLLPAIVDHERLLWPATRFEVRVDPGLPTVRGDQAYVEQVLRNLLGNAAKYGGGTVEVTASRAGPYVEISVLDDGAGFDDEDAERIFTLFYRSARAKAKAPGAGIGLFVTRHLVEAMGGTISAGNRNEGTGAAFTFTLPVFEEDLEP